MTHAQISNIRLEKVGRALEKYQNEWVAISKTNKIVAHGRTYGEAVDKAGDWANIILFKVPPLDASFAPWAR